MSKHPSTAHIYLITLVLAACSLTYELAISQALTILAANTVVWYSLAVGIFICSMGIGAFMCERLYQSRKTWEALYEVELALSVIGALSVPILFILHSTYLHTGEAASRYLAIMIFFIPAFAITFLVGYLSGLELPLLIRAHKESVEGNEATSAKSTSRILGMDYFGALIAGTLFPLVLIPNLDIFVIASGTALLNAAVGFSIGRKALTTRVPKGATSIVALLLLFGVNHSRFEEFFIMKYYYARYQPGIGNLYTVFEDASPVLRKKSPYQNIDLIEEADTILSDILISSFYNEDDASEDGHTSLYINGDRQAYFASERIYHEFFVHGAIQLAGSIPENILVLGAGDGLLARELLKYSEVREITIVELDQAIIELAKYNRELRRQNESALHDNRVTILTGDALSFLRTTGEKYDAIFIDFPFPVDYNLSKLYSKEFYTLVRDHMRDNGFAVLDAIGISQLFVTDQETREQKLHPLNHWPIYYNTLRAAGFSTIYPYIASLESDSQQAFLAIENSEILGEKEANPSKDEQTRRWLGTLHLVNRFVTELQSGFIFLNNSPYFTPGSYKDHGFPFKIFNKRRYELSQKTEFPRDEVYSKQYVNSILLPTLPLFSPFGVRQP